MKKITIKVITLVLMCAILISCSNAGVSSQELTGKEPDLPEELKGLKVYWVSTGRGSGINVAILNNQINSIMYPSGKTRRSVIILNKQDNNIIEVKYILSENDSVIVCKK